MLTSLNFNDYRCWTTHQLGWRLLITFVSLAERILALWLEAGASLSIRIRSLGFSFVRISIRLESIHLDLHSFGFRIDQNERLFFEEIASLSNFLINSWESNLQFVCKWKQLHHEILFWSILSFLIPLLIKWTHRHFEIETCINHIENFGKFGYTHKVSNNIQPNCSGAGSGRSPGVERLRTAVRSLETQILAIASHEFSINARLAAGRTAISRCVGSLYSKHLKLQWNPNHPEVVWWCCVSPQSMRKKQLSSLFYSFGQQPGWPSWQPTAAFLEAPWLQPNHSK